MNKNNKKKTLILSMIGLIGLIIVTIGITYAVFTYTKLGTTDNTVTSGTLKFLYTENTGVKTGIKLTNALPISDTQGKVLDGDNNVFDFSIEATNTGTEVIPYEVTLRKKSTSTLGEENVKVYLTDRTESTEKEELAVTKYSRLPQTNIDVGNEIEKTIYNGNVDGNTTNYKKDFRLRMWVDDTEDSSDIYGKKFTAMVNVYSNAKVITAEEQELRSNADIQSITIGDSVLTSVTDKDWNYEVTLDNPDTLKLNVIPKYALSSVKIEKDNQIISNNSEVSLVGGDNVYKVTITSADQKNNKEYKINIKVKQVERVSIFGKQYEVIDEMPLLTTTYEDSGDASGLYKSTATNTKEPTYYFRGAVENNYVSFAGFIWRIVRVNEDGTIRVIMQDGINDNSTYAWNTTSDYETFYFSNSNILNELESWYNALLVNYDSYIVNSLFCESVKVKASSNYKYNNVTVPLYDNYFAGFTCDNDSNNHGILYKKVGLISYDEVVYAGGFMYKKMNSWYLYSDFSTFMINPGGLDGTYGRGWVVYKRQDSISGSTLLSMPRQVRPVISIKSNVQVTGSGTSSDPFIII